MKVVIIGSGLLGMTSAYYLAEMGHDVTVVERNAHVASEASRANAAMLVPSLAAPFVSRKKILKLLKDAWSSHFSADSDLTSILMLAKWGLTSLRLMSQRRFDAALRANLALAHYNLDLLQKLVQEPFFQDFDYAANGSVMVYRDAAALRAAIQEENTLTDMGVAHTVLSPQGIGQLEPALAPLADKLAGGVYHSNDRHGDPWKFCKALEQRCQALGATFRFNTRAANFRQHGSRITVLETDQGDIAADAFVLAAGSFSEGLVNSLGVGAPLYPVKGYSLTVDVGHWPLMPRLPILDAQYHVSLTPLGRHLRIAGIGEFAGFKSVVRPARIAEVLRDATNILPQLQEFAHLNGVNAWSGFRPMSCDGVPMMGATRLENMFLNTGHGTLGWTMAAASGKTVAHIVSGTQPDIDITPYSPTRFS